MLVIIRFICISLFVYAETIKYIDLDIGVYQFNNSDHSVLDLLFQWSHIFNFYRKNKLYNFYHKELEYAYINFIFSQLFIIVKKTENEIIINKTINIINKKIKLRTKQWLKNPYLIKNSTPEYDLKNIVKTPKEYLYSLVRT